ncbi:hypothetical protein MVEG_00307 [Podila verticillata NRRL 6337]|nr:hypothetical protein MVEG_00307 [Podila verticillata NRRL 6337]
MMSFSSIQGVARASRHALFAIQKHSPASAASLALSHSTASRPMSIFAKAGLRSSPFSQPHSASIIRPTSTSFSRMNTARSSQQLRYSSNLNIHNPQLDEAGKELTVEITDNAVKQLNHIAARDKNPLQALRITVDSGGCHGYQYLMDLTDKVNEDDVVFEKGGARIIIDTITLPMVSGSRIDFIEELIGSAFKVLANPHAAHSCGCDTSFEIKI